MSGLGNISTGLTLADNLSISVKVGLLQLTLSDTVSLGVMTAWERSYYVSVSANVGKINVTATLTTNALFWWAGPSQLPSGSDNLPPFANWTWSVLYDGAKDLGGWTATSAGVLTRTIAWESGTFEIIGRPTFAATVSVAPSTYDGSLATGAGFVLSNQVTHKDPDLLSTSGALAPSMVRWSEAYVAPSTWNVAKGTVSFNYANFAPIVNFTKSLRTTTFLSLPAGSWGDGNLLPAGMPLNTSLLVNYYGHGTGYFPALTAYKTFVTQFAKDMAANHWTITYWNIGNEVPVAINLTLARAYANVFNVAEKAIHAVFPAALVGSDTLMGHREISYFESALHNVGFLSFHAYPAGNLCAGTAYCVPNNVNEYYRDAQVLQVSSLFHGYWQFMQPRKAQWSWFNATHHWIPVIDSESNLNSAQQYGSDPRQQSLFGAAWLGTLLIDGSRQNLSQEVYYSLFSVYPLPASRTSNYGGWGFGLMTEGPNDVPTIFAPYYATSFWAQNIPVGAKGLSVTNSQPGMIRTYAVRDGANLSLFLVNTGANNATITASVAGGAWTAARELLVDATTYNEVFNSVTGKEVLSKSSSSSLHVSGAGKIAYTIHSYGVALITYTSVKKLPSGNSSNNGTGNGTGTGGSGNTTGTPPGPPGGGSTGTGSPGTPPNSNVSGVGPTPPTSGNPPTSGVTSSPPASHAPSSGTGGVSQSSWFRGLNTVYHRSQQPFVLFALLGVAGALVAAGLLRHAKAHPRRKSNPARRRAQPSNLKPRPSSPTRAWAASPPKVVRTAHPKVTARPARSFVRSAQIGRSSVRPANRYGFQ
ncbi:MAG: hypothetical protein L3K07_04985 [Thermoplasmata archaeon]|nr:hypothetical protein [Thermoplasmata archaeon]